MKLPAPPPHGLWQPRRILFGMASILVTGLTCSGCHQSPEAPSVAQQQQSFEAQVQSIQSSPNMPAAAKQQAIAGIRAQQTRAASKP